MRESSPTAAPSAGLSTTAIVAIATGIGISLICIVALIVLLVRAVKNHKQLLADLEERGVSFAQVNGQARDSVTRPRTILRRSTVLPFNKDFGWGTLTSVETFKSADTPGVVAHYVPPKPSDAAKKSSRLSWPFHSRSVSSHNIHLKKMKGTRLSTVLEDPKPSALVPVLSSQHNASRPSLPGSSYYGSRPTSSQSLLQYHPAFRGSSEGERKSDDPPVSGNTFFRAGANDRLQRAKSFADVPTEPIERPPLRARSASLSSHTIGRAPDVILPPLPLDIARIKSEANRRSQLRRIPSKQSESSFDTADTSILASHASPVIPQVGKRRPQKITKPRTRGSSAAGSRPFRDSIDLRAKVLNLRGTPSSSPTRKGSVSLDMNESGTDRKSATCETTSHCPPESVPRSRPVNVRRTSSPTSSPRRCPATPKRKLASQPISEGSPEKQKRSTAPTRGYNGAVRSPKRQHSQTSSRSSGGNPFQWDPAPLASTGMPSALKGSPSARQGHRRKNSVRISLVPTFHGPPSRAPSPSILVERKEDTIERATNDKSVIGLGVAVPSTRSLPTPPSSSTFAPELKFPTTSLRASLTPTSPTLPLVGYDQAYVVFPTDQVMNDLSRIENANPNNKNMIRLPDTTHLPTSGLAREDNTNDLQTPTFRTYNPNRDFQMPPTPYLFQYPFRPETPEHEQDHSYSNLIDFDFSDSEQPSLAFQTPMNSSSRPWQSALATLTEESSVSSQKTVDLDRECHEDSPSVSPKTASPPRFNLSDHSAYKVPVYATAIPEEVSGTIDPAILDNDTVKLLNSTIKGDEGNFFGLPRDTRSSVGLVIPSTPNLTELSFEPLIEAAFPTGTPKYNASESPVLGHVQSEASSIYSLPSPLPSLSPTSSPIELPSPVMPCSPRPLHSQLPGVAPTVAINFSDVPKLVPSPRGPRRSPPRPLRTSIAALRRMNSDATTAKDEKAGRGERRYLRLGREVSVTLPEDESWLDDLEDDGSTIASEADGGGIAVSILSEWDEGQAILELDEGSTMDSLSTITPDTEIRASTFIADAQEDTMGGAQERESSIWEDGEKFWTSPTPSRHNSTQESSDRHQSFISSPPPPPTSSTVASRPGKRRDLEVANDSSPTRATPTKHRPRGRDRRKRRESVEDSDMVAGASSRRNRKQSMLGVETPSVKIQVTSPSGRIVAGTSGSLYDSQGFLRY